LSQSISKLRQKFRETDFDFTSGLLSEAKV